MSNLGFDPFWRWPGSPQPPEDPSGFGARPIDVGPVGVPGLHDWRPSAGGAGLTTPDDTLSGTVSPPWWGLGPSAVLENTSQPYLPWLRAPTGVPGFRPNPDGSTQTGETANGVRLMSGAYPPVEAQEQPNNVAGIGGPASGDVRLMGGAFAPVEPQQEPNDIAGTDGAASQDRTASRRPGVMPLATSAASIAVPASPSIPIDLGALAARFAPVVAAAAPAAAAALPFLFIPTNTQSESTELGDGLRARVRPGQRSVEIERRVHDGLFGIGAQWETLPVEAWQQVGRDGSVNTVINHEQLNRALGRSAPSEPKDVGSSAMAQSPKDGEPQQPPPTGTGSDAVEANQSSIANPPATDAQAPSRIDAKVLEEAKQRDPEEERLWACRRVRAMPGQSAPSGHYEGPGGIDAAVGIRVAPGFPAPRGGYDYSPGYLRHFNGYKGELELKNRIEKAVPYEKFVHYGNPAGDQGPDVLTIGPSDGRFMEWDSKSRAATRRISPNMASKATLKNQLAHQYAWDAMRARAVTPDAAAQALQELDNGNYNICTVGTGNAYDGYFEAVRKGLSTGQRR